MSTKTKRLNAKNYQITKPCKWIHQIIRLGKQRFKPTLLVGSISVEVSLIQWVQNLISLNRGRNLLSIVPTSLWRHQMQTFYLIPRIIMLRTMSKEQERQVPTTTQSYIIQTSRWLILIMLRTQKDPNIIMSERRIISRELMFLRKWGINSEITSWHSKMLTPTNSPITIKSQLFHHLYQQLHHLSPARKSVRGPWNLDKRANSRCNTLKLLSIMWAT